MSRTEIVFYGGVGVAVDTARYLLAIDKSLENENVVVSDVIDEGEARASDLGRQLGYPVTVHKDLSTVENFSCKRFVVTLGHSPIRDEKFQWLKAEGAQFYSVIDPSADVADTANIGEGCIIAPFCVVGPFADLGENVLLNIRSTIGHDATLGESCITSPHVAISGSVQCGKSVFFGAGTVVDPGVTIGPFSKFSSGSVVNANQKAGVFAFGNPAKGSKLFNPKTGHSLFAAK